MFTPHLHQTIFNKKISSFLFFGIIGFIAGTSLGIFLCISLNLSLWILGLLAAIGAFTFFALVFLVKIITGEENIVYYHHEIGILAACAFILKTFGLPDLVFLDITILGIAVFLAFGRIGCFSVGCCHGRPANNGVVYGHEHVRSGFTKHYEGISLFPVQLLESGFVFGIAILGTYLLLFSTVAPGTILIIYTIVYGFFRFVLEFFRGDPDRPYWHGFSEAQWTTLALFIISALFSSLGWLPFYMWHWWLVATLVVLQLAVFVFRKQEPFALHKIFNPHHIKEIAEGISGKKKDFRYDDLTILIFSTSLGLNISSGKIISTGSQLIHYTISSSKVMGGSKLQQNTVRKLGDLIQNLRHNSAQMQIKEGKEGIFHIVFHKDHSQLQNAVTGVKI